MRIILISALLILLQFSCFNILSAQTTKKNLTPEAYTKWKNISNQQISNDGKWVSYQLAPEVGDSWLYLYEVETGILDSVHRGINARFSPNSDFLVFTITPQYDTIRALKLKKVNEDKLPKDSMGVWILGKDSIAKIAEVKSFNISREKSSYIIYESSKEKKSAPKKTAIQEEKTPWYIFKKKPEVKATPKPAKEQKGKTIVLYQPIKGKSKEFKNVDDFVVSYNGNSMAYISNSEFDSINRVEVIVFNIDSSSSKRIMDTIGFAEKICIDRNSEQVAFLYAKDTNATDKVFDLYYCHLTQKEAKAILIVDTLTKGMIRDWSPSINATPYFSRDGKRLFFGTNYKPQVQPKDTLLRDEKYSVDIWSYQDRMLQPQQIKMLQREKRRTFLATYIVDEKKMVQLADSGLYTVVIGNFNNSRRGLGIDNIPYQRQQSWSVSKADYYIIDTYTGRRDFLIGNFAGEVELSTDGNYALIYDKLDSAWYSYDIEAKTYANLTANLKVPFYEEGTDVPSLPDSYGIIGWYKNDKYVVIRDKYDFWKIDPTGKTPSVNITKSYGRKEGIKFNLVEFDSEELYLNEEKPFFMIGVNERNKKSGYYSIGVKDNDVPVELISGDYRYFNPIKAKDTDRIIWRRGNFIEYNDLYTSTLDLKNIKRISYSNPQQSEYLWGTVEMIHWKAYDGQKMDGLLYKPENFDSTKQYPMIVYFYEKYSDDIHNHYAPRPSYSTINFTEYTSNGYLVFVPDITYKIGYPGKSAYNSIVSGTEYLKKFDWVDDGHIGIQGQSWGGYQVAWLVTQTNIYACAEAGAPVSNMTSAYGGIRWGSGVTRAFQYETGQSRIGVDMWKNRDLYIQNSPLFFADKVQTPILIMSNDDDGAVPWYQGIEYFCALRRLDKIAWMLTYNDDDHNLTKYPNRVDLSIRMMQFFDHYLKGKPAPEWMVKGLPAVNKGKIDGYNLITE